MKNKTHIIDRYIDRKQNKLHRFGAKLYLVNRNYRESNKLWLKLKWENEVKLAICAQINPSRNEIALKCGHKPGKPIREK